MAQLIEQLEPLFATSADAAAAYSATMYDDVRGFEIGEALPAVPNTRRKPSATAQFIRDLVTEGATIEWIIDKLKRRMTYEIKKAAGESVAYNAAKDPVKPKYARVPTGPETCEWCIMLASRGYVYASEKSAGGLDHWHENCDCVIMPQFADGFAIKGYDPAYYEKIWDDNVVYDEYGHVDQKATLHSIRQMTGRDAGYYEAHKEERHAYYEHVKEHGLIGGGESEKQGRNRYSKYAFEGSDDVPAFKDFNDVKDYLYASESLDDLVDREHKLTDIYGPGSEQILSKSLDNVIRTVLKRFE